MTTNTEEIPWFSPSSANGSDGPDEYEYDDVESEKRQSVFEAPDYSSIVGHKSSAAAKDYEQKVKSLVKAGVLGSLKVGNEHDAATLLHYGPGFASAMGDLTDVSDFVRKSIDILTAPDSPWFVAAAIATPMFMQLWRNHEREIHQVNLTRKQIRAQKKAAKESGDYQPAPKRHIEVKMPFGRKVSFNVRFRIPVVSSVVQVFKAQTKDPQKLVDQVFSDPKLRATLKKMGYEVKHGA